MLANFYSFVVSFLVAPSHYFQHDCLVRSGDGQKNQLTKLVRIEHKVRENKSQMRAERVAPVIKMHEFWCMDYVEMNLAPRDLCVVYFLIPVF